METQTETAPPQSTPPTAAGFTPAAPRGILKTGFPIDGYWLFTGLAKAGKTKLISSIPGAYIIETEKGGADRVSGWIQDVANLAEFRQALGYAFTNPDVKIIVIDTLDVVLKYLGVESANKYGLESLSEKREGINTFAVWDDFFGKVDRMVDKFKHCNKLVILVAHFKEPKLDSEGKLVISQSIDAPSVKASSHICAHADVIAVVSKKRIGDKSQYSLRFHGDGIVGAYGSRVPELEDKTVVLPKDNQWAAIQAVFNEAVETKTVKTETTAVKTETKPSTNGTKAAPARAAVAGGKR